MPRGGRGVGNRVGGVVLGGVKMGPMYFKPGVLVNEEEEGGKEHKTYSGCGCLFSVSPWPLHELQHLDGKISGNQ